MTTNPHQTRHETVIHSVHNPYVNRRTSSTSTGSLATNNSNSSTTSKATSNNNNSSNSSNSANNNPTDPEMNQSNLLYANSTVNNKKRGVEIYSEFALLHGYPEFELLTMPKTDMEMQSLKNLLDSFSNYLVHEARQADTNKLFAPGTAEGYFSSFYNALKSREGWLCFVTPFWYSGMGKKIFDKLTEKAADKGEIGSELQDKKKAITRTPFKNALHALLGSATPTTNVRVWQRW